MGSFQDERPILQYIVTYAGLSSLVCMVILEGKIPRQLATEVIVH